MQMFQGSEKPVQTWDNSHCVGDMASKSDGINKYNVALLTD
jgi:hypothetical protein